MIIVITGPTCTNKSETAVFLAEQLNAEIINADAFQIYKELNVGVAKPSPSLLEKVPHHLYSFVEPNKTYSIVDYQKDLREKIAEIQARGHSVIIVGGSGLYIRAGLYDYEFEENKPFDISIFEDLSNDELHEKLASVDPVEAEKIHPNNRKRVLRALAIFYSQGVAKSELIAKQKHELIYDVRFFALRIERSRLYERINDRVDKMIVNGLVSEVENLLKQYGSNKQCMQAIGYKELVPVVENNSSLGEAVEEIKKHTRNYAKRQLTFIAHQFPIEFYNDAKSLLEELKNE